MEIRNRQAALCLFVHEGTFLVAELHDPVDGHVLHRPPGGGIEAGETPEQAVRRELMEELEIGLSEVRLLAAVDHVWFYKNREVREKAWLFLADPAADPAVHARLTEDFVRGEGPELIEANGVRNRTLWRSLDADPAGLPLLCPAEIVALLRDLARS